MNYKRIYIEKKEKYDVKGKELLEEFKDYLKLDGLKEVRIVDLYDVYNISEAEKKSILEEVLYEEEINEYSDNLSLEDGDLAFRVKFLDTQYSQREDITKKILEKFVLKKEVELFHSEIIVVNGISELELEKIKKYYINPIEKKEIELDGLYKREIKQNLEDVEVIKNFKDFSLDELEAFKEDYGIGIDMDDLSLCQKYYKEENRDPSITELKLIDTYWSDHCRHTTFTTEITKIDIEEGIYKEIFEEALENYIESRKYAYEDDPKDRPLCLMDLATINMREQVKSGALDNKEVSNEINAASIETDVDVNGKDERWLLMFKNETHNHPTEMEPFGGAATCLGGAIRDPLSGRSYVYQAMRITGSADPREDFDDTIEGKLAQRKITRDAMRGYSSYGNQIGAKTGYVREYYDEGFVAKRLECGALVAAVPKDAVYRGNPEPGDLVVLLGGKTGRDGLGGAVGSSRKHTEDSLESSGAEVQKGNPLVERKIMRLFRKPEVSKIIKVCNDFGAGGVGVAIGELADGIRIDLDKIPLKYPGLGGTEIALAESQERMAVLIEAKDLEWFLEQAAKEDLEAIKVAEVTEEKILKMIWRDKEIVNIKREFLDTNGAKKYTEAKIMQPFREDLKEIQLKNNSMEEKFSDLVSDLNMASQKGLVENFDNTVGGGNILMPYGGKYRLTPAEGMVAKIPVLNGETSTCSIMTHGYDPAICKWSPFHGGYYAVIDSLARVVALGGDHRKVRLSLQEYFERIDDNTEKWGKPLAALLGAYEVQRSFDIAAIGGKDSMSGTFEDIDVPPTLISFAVTSDKVENIVSNEFKNIGSRVVMVKGEFDDTGLLDLEDLGEKYNTIKELMDKKVILSAHSVKSGGIARAIMEMSFGNKLGFKFEEDLEEEIFASRYGSIILEVDRDTDIGDLDLIELGETSEREEIEIAGENIKLDDLIDSWIEPLESTFPLVKKSSSKSLGINEDEYKFSSTNKTDKPRVIIPILPGTHGEYTLEESFKELGAEVLPYVFRTENIEKVEKSYEELADLIKTSHILALPDGSVYGDEPGGAGKLQNIILTNDLIKQAIEKLLEENDGLVIGVGNGFKALLRAGLIEGEFSTTDNISNDFISEIVDVRVRSKATPWASEMDLEDVYSTPLASSEARIIVGENIEDSQIITEYIDGNLSGSKHSIESIASLDGKVFGTMTSIDRIGKDLYKNIDSKGIHRIFESGVKYFK